MRDPNDHEVVFEPTDRWRSLYPEAYCGVVALRNVQNPAEHAGLEERKGELLRELNAKYSDMRFKAMKAFDALSSKK